MVLTKESSILGYPGEVSKSLNADHHDVCKYANQEDSNYVTIRNALKTLARGFSSRGMPKPVRYCRSINGLASPYSHLSSTLDIAERRGQSSNESELVDKLFTPDQDLEEDFAFLQQRWMPGTCEWILSEPLFKLWLEQSSGSRITWLNAPPASGKSVLSTYIVNHIREMGFYCQYFLVNFRDPTKRSTAALLRSIGLQMAKQIPAFRRDMAKFSREGVALEKKDARFMWHKIFAPVLSKMVLTAPLYWIIDALDELEAPRVLLELLQGLSTSRTPIHVLFTSRKIESFTLAFERLSVSIPVDIIQRDFHADTTSDIQIYVENELKFMRGTEDLKLQVTKRMLNHADGNFLWVRLVLEDILGCHTQQAIMQALEELPIGMSALYQRMEFNIANNLKEADQILAKKVLTWIVCAHHPLTVKELSQALTPDFPEFLDLKRTIEDVCGQFIVVDHSSRVTMVHKTARDFLTRAAELRFFIDEKKSHEELFAKTVSFLLRPELRSKIGRNQQGVCSAEPFLLYAATSSMHHLRQAATTSEDILNQLVKFFKGPHVLVWVHLLALFSQLEVLVSTARVLSWFSSLNRKLNVEKNPMLHRLQDLELFDLWATDLVKVVAKFGRHLLDDPTAIYKIVPPLCPRNSIMSRQFGRKNSSQLSIAGISQATWNDCLARISLRDGAKAWRIICAGRHIAVLSSTGSIILWDSINFEETCSLHHAELVTRMCFNSTCDRLVSYGFRTTKLWAIPSGQLIAEVANPADSKALAITFAGNDTKILVASDDKVVRHLYTNATGVGWEIPEPDLLNEDSPVEGGFITAPSFMAFNADATQIAVAYRGYPLSVWATDEPRLLGRCQRVIKHGIDRTRPSVSWMAVDRIAWSPVVDKLVGLYKDGCVFKWSPSGDENQEAHTLADEIEVSPDGKHFLTSDSKGTVKVWNFAYFDVIYQLSSENLVIDLAFSPDCKRFYDLRGSSVNAWEPNCLLRSSENGDAASDTASDFQTSTSMSQISEAWIVSIDPIIALAAAPGSQLYCVSHENGTVGLFDKTKGHLRLLSESTGLLISDHLTWSEDGSHVATADLGGNIKVIRLNTGAILARTAEVEVQSLFAAKSKHKVGGIHQILLNGDSTKLLVVSQGAGQIWSVETASVVFSGVLERGETRKWMNLPGQTGLLLGIGPRDLEIIRWENLAGVASLKYSEDGARFGGRSSSDSDQITSTSMSHLSLSSSTGFKEEVYVHKAIATQDSKYLLVQICKRGTRGRTLKYLAAFEHSLLASSYDASSPVLFDCLKIPDEMMTRVEVPLGILPGTVLVFLDKDLWMCTLRMNSKKQLSDLKRHYFMPRDWASTESLDQCCMLQDGTFLFPKDGEVAVITSSLGGTSW